MEILTVVNTFWSISVFTNHMSNISKCCRKL